VTAVAYSSTIRAARSTIGAQRLRVRVSLIRDLRASLPSRGSPPPSRWDTRHMTLTRAIWWSVALIVLLVLVYVSYVKPVA
jgi:hypothetical protein